MIGLICAGGAAVWGLHLVSLRFRRPRISISGKHIVITGGSQGLGKAAAEQCFKAGARVTIVARDAVKLREACEKIGQSGGGTSGKIQFFTLDIASAGCTQVSELLAKAAETFGRVDVFIANAGMSRGGLMADTPLAEMDQIIDSQVSVNLTGTLRCAIAAAQAMAADGQGGRVSMVSSALGLVSMPGYAIYSATKFGVRGFLQGTYEELKQHGIYLSVYYPGSIRTPGFQVEQEELPQVAARVEAHCSDISSADAAAKVLISGILNGQREISNELLPSLLVDTPTGSLPVDMAIAGLVQVIRVGWNLYLRVMSSLYIPKRAKPPAESKKEQ